MFRTYRFKDLTSLILNTNHVEFVFTNFVGADLLFLIVL